MPHIYDIREVGNSLSHMLMAINVGNFDKGDGRLSVAVARALYDDQWDAESHTWEAVFSILQHRKPCRECLMQELV